MDLLLRPPERDDLEAASELCLRSKAYWGYDAAFMAACREELTITPEDVDRDPHILAVDAKGIAGIAQVSFENGECYLEKCFVDTDRIGQGVGRVLYEWAVQSARTLGASEMIIEGRSWCRTLL